MNLPGPRSEQESTQPPSKHSFLVEVQGDASQPRVVSAVICAKNEERSIGDVIKGCLAFVDEIIVVDGHSSDDTRAIASELGGKVILDSGGGKGVAIRESLDHVRGDLVVFLDADGSHDPADIPRLLEPLLKDNADHVTGSRLLGGSSELHGGFDEFLRLTGSSFITACINWRFCKRLSDSQNGFRAARTDVLRDLNLRENSTTIEQEMIMKTLLHGYRMAEVPTHEHKRRFGESHISVWRAAPHYVWCLVRYCFIARRVVRRQTGKDQAQGGARVASEAQER